VAIYALGDVEPSVDPTAYVHPDAVVIGDVRIGPESSVWPQAVLRGDAGHIEIGARTSIQDGAVIHCTHRESTYIGDDCTIGHLAHLEGCRVGNLTLIGTGSIVLNGAVVGDEALVAAGALVGPGKEVPSHHRAIGVPAAISELTSHTNDRSAAGYVGAAKRYRKELRRLD
jgi:carbonic anhydrase/acetyltransferase-like protein (isoleucine patch superfamily)